MTQNDLPAMPEGDDRRLKARPSRARYDKVHHNLERRWRRRCDQRHDRMMKEIVDEIWDQFANSPYAWCGFYVFSPDGSQLLLGHHRDKSAGSPLPMQSVAGKAVTTGRTQIVSDAQRRWSEIAVPVFDEKGKAWAALDVESAELGAFDEMDQRWLERLLKVFAQMPRPSL